MTSKKPASKQPSKRSMLPFPKASFCEAQQVSGFVATTATTPPLRQRSMTSLSAPPPPANTPVTPRPPTMQLPRQESVAGNILNFQSDKDNNRSASFLLQRKLEQTNSHTHTIRAGYPLVSDQALNVTKGKKKNNGWNKMWEVQPDPKLVAIHIFRGDGSGEDTTGDGEQSSSLRDQVHYNPIAEWHVWQQGKSPYLLAAHWMGSHRGTHHHSNIGAADSHAHYYSVTPWHCTSLWDDLCQRQTPPLRPPGESESSDAAKEAAGNEESLLPPYYTEDEARVVFVQLLKCLQRLRQMELCHRNITLHNLLLVEENEEETTKRICLARHGWTLRVGSNKRMCIPPPSTAEPLYVAPEWLSSDSSSDGRKMTEGEPNADNEEEDDEAVNPYALDLWSATMCLLILLVGAPQVPTVLFAAPLPQDPKFVAVTHNVQTYFDKALGGDGRPRWSAALCDLLQRLLHPNPEQRLTNLQEIEQHTWMVTGVSHTDAS